MNKENITAIAIGVLTVIAGIVVLIAAIKVANVGIDILLGVEFCEYRKGSEVCGSFDKRSLAEGLAMLLIAKPSLYFLWKNRK